MSAAAKVFDIPELLELILLSLPWDSTYHETSSIRTIQRGQGTCRAWRAILERSTPIRQKLYRPTPADELEIKDWLVEQSSPPARPNPWIPDLLLNSRGWGSAYPFDSVYDLYNMRAPEPRLWTFSFEVSRAQYQRFPCAGLWRDMLATSPPFTDFWYTRCFYELGSGRAPFVTHVDYDANVSKSRQKYTVHHAAGITLGMIVDAVTELFDGHPTTKFVMVESLRVHDGPVDLTRDRPTTKTFIPGSSAEKAHGWHREL